ncbi:MAG TPA: phasin [Hyphomicrobium sp.]|nr:phasin [Hyphomicrobium sp.]
MANTETKARAAKAAADTTAKATASAAKSATNDVVDAAFAYPQFEVPEMFRSFAEQGLTQTRDAYARLKAAAEETTDILEESFETTRDNVREVQFKALDVARENADATFELVRKMLTVTSVADAVQLQTAFARERFEAFVDYSKDVQATWTKVGTEAAKPAKALFDRALSQAKAA